MNQIKKKEPYEALGARNGCLAAPIIYLIAGFLVLPSTAFLALVIVLRESIAAWGDLIVMSVIFLWPLTLIILAWAYVAGKRAESKRGPTEISYVSQGGMTGTITKVPEVKVERPEPKGLPRGDVPWVITEGLAAKPKVGTITKK